MTSLPARLLPLTGALAALVFVGAVAGFGVALSGYSQVWHPVAVLGAKGVPHALGFNLLGFVLTGVLAAVAAEVAYRGIVSGTYPLASLALVSAQIAQHAEQTTQAVEEVLR